MSLYTYILDVFIPVVKYDGKIGVAVLKRILPFLLVILFLFSGCTQNLQEADETTQPTQTTVSAEKNEEVDEQFIGSWLTYIEMKITPERSDEQTYRKYIEDIFENLHAVGVNNIFIHARPFADALYESDINVSSVYVAPEQGGEMYFDAFGIAVQTARRYDMKAHGWINPYRVSSTDNFDELCDDNIAKQWYRQNSDNVFVVDKKIYFNPASPEVQKLLLDTADELMEKYELDGIHIDDYFYPENCGDFDKAQYEKYLSQSGSMSLEDFRRENVNSFVSSMYMKVKSFGENKIFSISPEAKIDKNYNEKYADTALWCTEKGYADIIIPQIYYGFENESMPFEETLKEWAELCSGGAVKLVPGLALYKSGNEDSFAGETGKNEWIENKDIIKRQVQCLEEYNCYGFSLYSSSYVNFNETFLSAQLQNLKSVL